MATESVDRTYPGKLAQVSVVVDAASEIDFSSPAAGMAWDCAHSLAP